MNFIKKLTIFMCLLTVLSSTMAAEVIIDAGHGGKDPGAVRPHTDGKYYREKDFTLDMARQLHRELTKKGRQTVLIRNSDRFVPLSSRLSYSRQHCEQLFLSIHVDTAPNTNVKGVGVFIHHHADAKTARIAQNIQKAFNPKRQIRRANFMVLRNQKCPSILVEMGYMSNAEDLAKLINFTTRQAMVTQLSNSVDKSLPKNQKQLAAEKNKTTPKNAVTAAQPNKTANKTSTPQGNKTTNGKTAVPQTSKTASKTSTPQSNKTTNGKTAATQTPTKTTKTTKPQHSQKN